MFIFIYLFVDIAVTVYFINTISWCSTRWRRPDGWMRTDADEENKRSELKGGFHLLFPWQLLEIYFFFQFFPFFCYSSNNSSSKSKEQVGLGDRYETAAAHNQTERNEETYNKNPSHSILAPSPYSLYLSFSSFLF